MQHHVIHRQLFELTAPSVRLAQQWEQHAQVLLNDVVTPALERQFDKHVKGSTRLIVDRLEIDIGVINQESDPDEIQECIARALRNQLNSGRIERQSDGVQGTVPGGTTQAKPASATAAAAFNYYLKNGRLPWWGDQNALPQMMPDVLSDRDLPELKQLLRNRAAARIRLILAIKPDEFFSIISRFTGDRENVALEFYQWLTKSNQEIRNEIKTWAAQMFFKFLLENALELNTDHSTLTEIFYRLIVADITTKKDLEKRITAMHNRYPEMDQAFQHALEMHRHSESIASGNQKDGAENGGLPKIEATSMAKDSDFSQAEISNSGQAFRHEHGSLVSAADTIEATHNRFLETAIATDSAQSDAPKAVSEDEGVYVQNAGIVILHPFLTELFRTARLWDDGWTSPTTQHVAVSLLSYCVHGSIEIPEYMLLMEKLLCGMPWKDVHVNPGRISSKHQKHCDELLDAVIRHWNALGKTSHDGLREGFFMREGKINKKENTWVITVEKKAQDILLAKLPWGLSYIHLPWCAKAHLKVDWV